MKNFVENLMDNVEKELEHTKSSYKKKLKTVVYNHSFQAFRFDYRMKNGDTLTFGIQYIGDFHIEHKFRISCKIAIKGEFFDYKSDQFKQYFMEHAVEMGGCYHHFLTCFQKTMEQHPHFRLHYKMNAEMVENDIENEISQFLLK